MGHTIGHSHDNKKSIADFNALFEHRGKRSGAEKTVCARQSMKGAREHESGILGAKLLATFGATGAKYCPTACGGHARTKSMRTFAFQDAGLECSFHNWPWIAVS